MTSHATETNVQMAGAGLLGSDMSGSERRMSRRFSFASALALLLDDLPTVEPLTIDTWWIDNGVLTKTLVNIPPTFTLQPVNTSANETATATFTVTAINHTGLQWQLDSGGGFADLAGETGTSYTTPVLALTDGGDRYRCVATGAGGTTNSTEVILSVNSFPYDMSEISSLRQWALTSTPYYGSTLGGIEVLAPKETYGTYRLPRKARKYQFDGTDDYLLRASALSLTDFTFCCWLEPQTATGTILGASTTNYVRFSTTATVVARIGGTNTTITLTQYCYPGERFHFAFVRSGTTATCYKNGVAISAGTTVNGSAFDWIRVGITTANSLPYRGGMANLKVYSSAKDASAIAAIYAESGTLADATNCVAWHPCNEESGATSYNAIGANNLTITSADTTLGGTFHAASTKHNFNSANVVGHTVSGDVIIPRNESDPTKDCTGAALQYTGVAPNPISVSVPCFTADGSDDYLAVSDLVGTETVTSSSGTSTPSIAAGRVNFTAGTCTNLVLSSGHRFIFQEGSGTTVYNVGTGADGTITNATTTKQAGAWAAATNTVQSWRVLYGGRIGASDQFIPGETTGSLCVDGNVKTLLPGKVCVDGGLTVVNFNPFSMAGNNGLHLETAYTGGARDNVVPCNTKFGRIRSDGIDRLFAFRSAVTGVVEFNPGLSELDAAGDFAELTVKCRQVTLPAEFTNWSLTKIFKRGTSFIADLDVTDLYPQTDQTLYVATTGNDSNDGLTLGAAKLTISGALTAATGVPLVVVGAGTFAGTGVTKTAMIQGVGDTTIISGSTPTAGVFSAWKSVKFSNTLSTNNSVTVVDSVTFAASGADASQCNGSTNGYFFNCSATDCAADVFNYNGTAQAIEVSCSTNNNGTIAGHNASTGHNSSRIVRVNGTYTNSPSPIHDVNDTQSILFGCSVSVSKLGAVTGAYIVAAGSSSIASESAKVWCYSCTIAGPSEYDLYADTDGNVYYTSDTTYSTKSAANVTQFSEVTE